MRLGLTTAAFYGRLETEEAAARLRSLAGTSPFERFLRSLAEGDELGALETFLEQGERRIRALSTDDMRATLMFAL